MVLGFYMLLRVLSSATSHRLPSAQHPIEALHPIGRDDVIVPAEPLLQGIEDQPRDEAKGVAA